MRFRTYKLIVEFTNRRTATGKRMNETPPFELDNCRQFWRNSYEFGAIRKPEVAKTSKDHGYVPDHGLRQHHCDSLAGTCVVVQNVSSALVPVIGKTLLPTGCPEY